MLGTRARRWGADSRARASNAATPGRAPTWTRHTARPPAASPTPLLPQGRLAAEAEAHARNQADLLRFLRQLAAEGGAASAGTLGARMAAQAHARHNHVAGA